MQNLIWYAYNMTNRLFPPSSLPLKILDSIGLPALVLNSLNYYNLIYIAILLYLES